MQGQAVDGASLSETVGHLRPRRRAADRPLVALAPEFGRILAERSGAAVRELLLRRVRQQLRRPPRREALPGVRGVSRRRPSTRSAAATSRSRRSSGTCRRGASAAPAHRGSTPRGCARRSSLSGVATNLDAASSRRSAGQRRRPGGSALHDPLGAGADAVCGRRASRSNRIARRARGAMVSLKVL